MDTVFVSSVMEGFEAERSAAKRAIESLGLRPLMAETTPSSPEPSKHALLSLVAEADVVVLILGSRYGWVGPDGRSPTEDEYLHALASNVPVLAFLQDTVQREPLQEEFVARVSGGWDEGLFRSSFASAEDLGFRVVQAINSLQRSGSTRQAHPAAQARALELAAEQNGRGAQSGPAVRVTFVPVGGQRLLDPLTLDDASFGERLAGVLRITGLVTQAQAIEFRSASRGAMVWSSGSREPGVSLLVAADGAVSVEGPAGTSGDFVLSAFSYPRIEDLVLSAGKAALAAWALLPRGDSVRQVAATLSVPEPGYLPLSLGGVIGNSMQMGSSHTEAIVAPQPAEILDGRLLSSDSTARLLAVSLKQEFADRGSVIA